MQLGIDRLLHETALKAQLNDARLGLLAHPASMTQGFIHSMDAIAADPALRLCAAFGPQHGIRGDKQDNMVESANDVDHRHRIPVYSLYGDVRRPTEEMLQGLDAILIDIQDVGCRIYTFISTLFYLLQACANTGKSVWVLDRPNPAGRPIEGLKLLPGQESFVGVAPMPMRHGLTLGEAAQWFVNHCHLDVSLEVVEMLGYDPLQAPGFGWPLAQLPWVNPSPNIATVNAVRAYPGTVFLEGTTLSEGRGTTRPLELFGAPDLDPGLILQTMRDLAPTWLQGCLLREAWFEPTFHKHQHQLCAGLQIHTDYPGYDPNTFKPYRLLALFLKSLRLLSPQYEIWRDFPYEYETQRLAIDVINGGTYFREWVDDTTASTDTLEQRLAADESSWRQEISTYILY